MSRSIRRVAAAVALATAVLLTGTACWPFDSGPVQQPPPNGGGPTNGLTGTTQPSTPPPATTPPTQAATGLSGTWSGHWANSVPDQSTGSFTISWTQSGDQLSGTIVINGTPCLTGGSITGTVHGSSITFGAVHGEVSVDYTGAVAGNTMSGTYATDCGHARGAFTASKK